MNYILAVLTILFIVLIGIIPFFLLYGLSDFVRFILFRVLKYRRAVVELNLKNSFPDLSTTELKKLTARFYKNLADVTIEGIKGFSMTRYQIRKRHQIMNPEVPDAFFDKGQSVIAVTGHYCNWEWGSMSGSLQLKHNSVALYKPLSNHLVDRFVKWSRTKYGTKLASIYETSETFEQSVSNTTIFAMAADQSPSNVSKAIWVNYLGRETAFLHGPEFYARKYNMPVVFVEVQRERRGHYKIQFSELVKNPIDMEPGEITRLYAHKLEEMIRAKPENWLWSHRRWKHSR